MTEIFHDALTTIIQGDARHMAELPDNSVPCCVTSPPYWGLRKYAGEQELVWDEDKGCDHVWGDSSISREMHQTGASGRGSPTTKIHRSVVTSGLCQKCGAWRGSLGLEPSPESYISHLIEICREIKRVLRPDGVFWLNIGDSYAGSGKGKGDTFDPNGKQESNAGSLGLPVPALSGSLKPLDLCLIPERLAIALQADGWYVRARIAWQKTNPMPESMNGVRGERHKVKVREVRIRHRGYSVGAGRNDSREGRGFDSVPWNEYKDCPGCPICAPNDGLVLRRGSWRPTDSWEHIWMLTKTDRYYCDKEAVVEPSCVSELWNEPNNKYLSKTSGDGQTSLTKGFNRVGEIGSNRNLRSVWTFPSRSGAFPGQHFAAFPEKLPETCIKASTSEYGVCAKCGAQYARVVDHTIAVSKPCPNMQAAHEARGGTGVPTGTVGKSGSGRIDGTTKTIGWRATCTCNADRVPATVLDPFCGTGTTLWAAKRLGRRGIGYDLSEQYVKLSLERNRQGGLGIG